MSICEGVVRRTAILAVLAGVLISREASALPFNDDMVDIQKRTGAIMRQKVPGTVPVGSSAYYLAKKADAENLTNPLKDDPNSVASGQRLWMINCSPCHGDISKKPYTAGYVASKLPLVPPDPTGDAYKSRTDGFFYGTIHFGGAALMPPLGWKLSPNEHWDIINYIRSEQGTK